MQLAQHAEQYIEALQPFYTKDQFFCSQCLGLHASLDLNVSLHDDMDYAVKQVTK